MTKIGKSKNKALRSTRKKPAKKAAKAKRAIPKIEQSRSKQPDSTETRGSKRDHPMAGLSTPVPVQAAGVERLSRRLPRPFLLPFAVMDMWFRVAEPKGDGK